MIEISKEMAKYLFNTDKEVFKLYDDGCEAVIEDFEEIDKHEGIFGREL